MGVDTDDGRGERMILSERRSYVKPLLTPGGSRIVYSSRVLPGPPEVFVVNFDGSQHRKLADGFALDVWLNPVDEREWVYVGTDNDQYDFKRVYRFPIDAPAERELFWSGSVVGADGFRVSRDGRHFGGLCPWPAAGVTSVQKGEFEKFGEGCWTSLTSVRGLLFWIFDGAHRNVTMVDVEGGAKWMVNLTGAAGFEGAEVYHPRWSNHPRFMTMSGPYNQGGPNQARTGGRQVEIYAGRFSADYTSIEAWARVTTNTAGDTYPDVWIDSVNTPHARRSSGSIGPPALAATGASRATAAARRLVVNVRVARPGPVPDPESILPYRNALVVNEYEIVDVLEGEYDGGGSIQIAQWAIRDSQVLPDARKDPGAGFTLSVERYEDHPELEGERLVSDREIPRASLYYETRLR
jgi:hypothetical protein